jgi:RNA polymerase sigma-70 factor (ECF subfamily)
MAGVPATVDSAGFAAFVQRHRAELVRAASRIAVDSAEAEDVVQDTLMALWRRWQHRLPDDPPAYAFRAVTLNAIKRRMRRRPAAPLEAANDLPAAPTRAAESLNPLELERAIARLPLAQQTIVRMRFYLGLSLAQIGRNLSISSNTAASRCRYALAALRKA